MDRIARALGQAVVSSEPLSGGCISNARRVRTSSGDDYFCKLQNGSTNLFIEEAAGLNAIAATETIRAPRVVHFDSHMLILEWIEPEEPKRGFWSKFGQQLARLHQVPQSSF